MGQEVARTSKELKIGIEQKIGYAAGVKAGVSGDLFSEFGVLLLLFKDHSPIGVELLINGVGEFF